MEQIDATSTTEFKPFSTSLSLDEIRQRQLDFCNARNWKQYQTPRNLLFALIGEVGELAELFQWEGELDVGVPTWDEKKRKRLGEEISDCLIYLIALSQKCRVDLPKEAWAKLERNKEKYKAEANGVVAYDAKRFKKDDSETEANGIHVETVIDESKFSFSPKPTFEEIRLQQTHWINSLGWTKITKPRDCVLSFVAECGELSELFRFKQDVREGLPAFTCQLRAQVAEELADCFLNLILVAQFTGVDMAEEVFRKMDGNERKYPAERCYGSSKKYNEY